MRARARVGGRTRTGATAAVVLAAGPDLWPLLRRTHSALCSHPEVGLLCPRSCPRSCPPPSGLWAPSSGSLGLYAALIADRKHLVYPPLSGRPIPHRRRCGDRSQAQWRLLRPSSAPWRRRRSWHRCLIGCSKTRTTSRELPLPPTLPTLRRWCQGSISFGTSELSTPLRRPARSRGPNSSSPSGATRSLSGPPYARTGRGCPPRCKTLTPVRAPLL